VAGTRVAAGCLGWEDRLGTLEPGKLADLIVVRRDPLADIRSLADRANVALVMQGGAILKDARTAPTGGH
jgi:imidazolonepropionase-like amidohydrolase